MSTDPVSAARDAIIAFGHGDYSVHDVEDLIRDEPDNEWCRDLAEAVATATLAAAREEVNRIIGKWYSDLAYAAPEMWGERASILASHLTAALHADRT